VYNEWYTPIHHRALHNLETWHENDIESQVTELLERDPWTEAEVEALSRTKLQVT
jgi:hypothetical protein